MPKNPRQAKLEEQQRLEREEAERLRRLAAEREERLEVIQKDVRENNLRRAILADSDDIFNDLLQKIRNLKDKSRDENIWLTYVKCDPLPDTKVPSAVRSFLYRFLYEYDSYCASHLNWLVRCDERSLLTQDITVPDTTRPMIAKHREPTGKFYARKLRFMMKVYDRLEETLRRRQKVSADLAAVRNEMRATAFEFLDALTFEIITHIDREMNSMTPLVAHYSCASPDFIKFIWSFKDVTLPARREKLKTITMKPLNLTVTMSSELDLEGTCVRGLWFKRDLFSDHCPSFAPLREIEFQSLPLAVESETMIKSQMRKARLDEMQQRRASYESRMAAIRKMEEERESKKKKEISTGFVDFKSKAKAKKIKIPIEPPHVDDSTYVSVEEEYVEFERSMAENDCKSLAPENMSLQEHEVNMRDYRIIAGVYKIECLERPLQTKQVGDRLFIRLNERPHVLKYQNFTHTYQQSRFTITREGRMSVYMMEKMLEAKAEALATLTRVDITLPSKIVWFEPPIVCRWEKWEESDDFLQLDPKLQNYNQDYENIVRHEQEKLFNAPRVDYYDAKRKFADFQLSSHPTDIKLLTLVEHYLAPILPEEYLHHYEKLELFQRRQRAWNVYTEQEALKATAHGHEEMKRASAEALMTLDEFLKHFERKYEKPRTLFPKIAVRKIEVERDERVLECVRAAREELRETLSYAEWYDMAIEMPMRDEPVSLSELLDEFDELERRLMPLFKEIKKLSEENLVKETKKSKKPKKKVPVKNRNVSVMARKSIATKRRSTKFSKKSKKSSSSVTDSTREELSALDDLSDSQKLVLIPHHKGKWSTKGIHEVSYDRETRTLTFHTERYGVFALATRKYVHLPLKNWEVYPGKEQGEEERVAMLKIETQHITLEFTVSASGFTFKILKPGRMPVQEITKPLKFFHLKALLTSLNMNVFPEIDACHYIEDCITEKHHAMEFHTYKSMATYCLSFHFKSDELNSAVDRRKTIVNCRPIAKSDFQKVLITPLRVMSIVENNEKRDDASNSCQQLPFEIEPLEQEFHPDLLTFLKGDVDKSEQRRNQECFLVIWHMQVLLQNLRPLSFSQ